MTTGHHAEDRDSAEQMLRLRPLTTQDAEAMAEVLADPSLYDYTGGEPPTPEELSRRYAVQSRGSSADGREIWMNLLVILPEGPIGYVQATIPADDEVAEIAWTIGKPWQGRGHAKRAVALLAQELSARGVGTLIAHIHPDHAASEHVAASLGMTPTDHLVDGERRWQGRWPASS